MTDIIQIQEDVKSQLANPEVLQALVATTFKGLKQEAIPQAITEGVMRGFTFKDFLEKNMTGQLDAIRGLTDQIKTVADKLTNVDNRIKELEGVKLLKP